MIKRPRCTETEDDLLAQQEEMRKTNFKDISVVVSKKEAKEEEFDASGEKGECSVLSDIVEKNLNTRHFQFDFSSISEDVKSRGFPIIEEKTPFTWKEFRSEKMTTHNVDSTKEIHAGASVIWHDESERTGGQDEIQRESDRQPEDPNGQKCSKNPQTFDALEKEIHEENVERLKQMSEQDILDEQANLIKNLDPKLIEFLKSRKRLPNRRQEVRTIQQPSFDEIAKDCRNISNVSMVYYLSPPSSNK